MESWTHPLHNIPVFNQLHFQ
jgi:hypothetical protein